jgi:hypothetical protein
MTKKLELVREFSGVELFGELVCWSCNGVKVTYHQVLAALKQAELDQNVARKLLPRNAFKRACKSLAQNRVIREVKELSTSAELVFQFTSEIKGDDQKFRYEIEDLVKINRETGRIECGTVNLQERAQSLLDDAIEGRTGSDVTRIIQRLFEQNADLFPARDRGGMYFVPIAFHEFLDKVKMFMSKMGGKLDRWPIPAGMVESRASVKDSITAGLDQCIQDHFAAIDLFSESTRPDTYARHEQNIETTRFKLEAYQALLDDKAEHLSRMLSQAKEKLRTRMAGIFSDFDDLPAAPASPATPVSPTVQPLAQEAYAPEPSPATAPVDEDYLWESEDRYEVPEAEPEAEATEATQETSSNVVSGSTSATSALDALFDWA